MVKANSKHISQNAARVITCQQPPIPVRVYLHISHQCALIFELAAHSLKYPPSHIRLNQSINHVTTKCLIIPWISFLPLSHITEWAPCPFWNWRSFGETSVTQQISYLIFSENNSGAGLKQSCCMKCITWKPAGRFLDVITELLLCRLSNMICQQQDRKLCYWSWLGASRGVWHFIFSPPSQWWSSRKGLFV